MRWQRYDHDTWVLRPGITITYTGITRFELCPCINRNRPATALVKSSEDGELVVLDIFDPVGFGEHPDPADIFWDKRDDVYFTPYVVKHNIHPAVVCGRAAYVGFADESSCEHVDSLFILPLEGEDADENGDGQIFLAAAMALPTS